MKKLGLIYNPAAGNGNAPLELDSIIEILQGAGYDVGVFRAGGPAAGIDGYLARAGQAGLDAVCVCGGDGTVNLAVNAMLGRGLNAPLGIIPCGTANDFASFLNLPGDPLEAAKVVVAGDFVRADVGRVNGSYFVNVFAAGVFSGVSKALDQTAKNSFGKLAYYAKGLSELQSFKPLRFRISAPGGFLAEEELYLAMVLNTAGTGGFRELSPLASITDGRLEFIGVRARTLGEMAVLFLRMLTQPRGYLSDENIIYFSFESLRIEPLFGDEKYLATDTDGEAGPGLPAEISVMPKALRVFV